jgi:ubiquinone/menaquinone biosynthesis C-methylase UbiE
MAVIYMKKLELEPQSYERGFSTLTMGINLKVQDWVLARVKATATVVEFGCGPGTLAINMANAGMAVVAFDKNMDMINLAKTSVLGRKGLNVTFKYGSVESVQVEQAAYDVVVSTFLLSELRPFEQQAFLRKSWQVLKPGGRLLVADEFVPSGPWKLGFKARRWLYKRKMRRLKSGETYPLAWFTNYPERVGFKLISSKSWKHGSIRALEYEKVGDDAGYYRPRPKPFKGVRASARVARCVLTGQVDHVAIEPGIYAAGKPGADSPVIVTANYEYTYIRVMQDLAKGKVDAWVLALDTDGINVWCGARGGHMGNKQLLEAVSASGIETVTTSRVLILPQLAAGGVEAPKLPKKTEEFPFTVRYGPVWSKDLPAYLTLMPARKPEAMKLASFTFSKRSVAATTHAAFMLRLIFGLPIVALVIIGSLLGLFLTGTAGMVGWLVARFGIELFVSIVVINGILAVAYPIARFTRKFIIRGILFGIVSVIVMSALKAGWEWLVSGVPWSWYTAWNLPFYFWLAFFTTMSFSGYTMDTSPRDISGEYLRFTVLNVIFAAAGITLLVIGAVLRIVA